MGGPPGTSLRVRWVPTGRDDRRNNAHAATQANLIAALHNALRGKPCRALGSHFTIAVAGSIRYSDASVVCTPIGTRDKMVTEPVVVFEILSPRTENTDLFAKNAEYRATASMQCYVVLRQTRVGALVVSRKGEDWVSETISETDGTLPMPEIGIEIAMADLYADVELATEPTED